MNIQEYISSGIIESYVLGLASSEEQQEFERRCIEYPELVDAREAFEKQMEQEAMKYAITPPADVKAIIQDRLRQDTIAKVVALPQASRNRWLKYAVAAAIVLLTGSVIWNISLYNRNRQLQSEYARLDTNYNNAVVKLDNMEADLRMIQQNPHVKMAAMKGMPEMPSAIATVYWDSTSKDVYLLVTNLPMPASDRQYQLWALLDGKPIDLGMIANEYLADQKRLLLRMKNVNGAQAFAVTLEAKGGSPTPKGPMYVLGNL